MSQADGTGAVAARTGREPSPPPAAVPTPAREGDEALVVTQLTAGYARAPVIENVDLEVRKGEVVLLAGPNGAGKSTLVKAIIGTIRRFSGKVTVLGNDVTGQGAAELIRSVVAYVPQQDDVFLSLSVHDNLMLGGYLLPRAKRHERVEQRLAEFPALAAAHRRAAGTLSGGQRKTLALARALMLDPQVVILDEPTAGLAPKTASQILIENIAPLSHLGKAVLMVEQRVTDALRVADLVTVLVAGRVVLSEAATAFTERPDAGRWLMGAIPEQEASQRHD
jgi:ABC-type branched-subunit amino acid transport system ATPase component